MIVYLVIEHTRDGSCSTTNENVYYTIAAYSKKDSAEKCLINYAKENGGFKKKERGGDIFYKRIDYSGSLIDGDEDYTELYIDELKVETES